MSMYSTREELISAENEMRLLQNGLSLELMLSCTLETEGYKEFTNPFASLDYDIHFFEQPIPNHDKEFKARVRDFLRVNSKGLLRQFIVTPVYRRKDPNKDGWTLRSEPDLVSDDSDLIAFTYQSKQRIRKTKQVKYISEALRQRSVDAMQGEVAEYSAWLKDDVYGFILRDGLGVSRWREEHACYNAYGYVDARIERSIRWAGRGAIQKLKHTPIVISYQDVDISNVDHSALSYLNSLLLSKLGIQLSLVDMRLDEVKKEISGSFLLNEYVEWASRELVADSVNGDNETPIKVKRAKGVTAKECLIIQEILNNAQGYRLVKLGCGCCDDRDWHRESCKHVF